MKYIIFISVIILIATTSTSQAHINNILLLSCKSLSKVAWTEAEKWTWSQICAGRTADFNARYGYVDPRSRYGWVPERRLRSSFLETILLYEPFRSAMPRSTVSIAGAQFTEFVDLDNSDISIDIILAGCRFGNGLSLSQTHISKSISLYNSRIASVLNMHRIRVADHLTLANVKSPILQINRSVIDGYINANHVIFETIAMNDIINYGGIMLDGAYVKSIHAPDIVIGKDLDIRNSTVKSLYMKGAKISGSVTLCGGTFDEVNAPSAHIDGSLNICRAIFHSKLNIQNITATNGVLGSNSTFCDIDLSYAHTGYVNFSDSSFTKNESNKCHRSINMLDARISESISLPKDLDYINAREIRVDGSVLFDSDKNDISLMDLSGAIIGKELYLGSSSEEKNQTTQRHLVLAGATIGSLRGTVTAWPSKINLIGLTYNTISGISANQNEEMHRWPAETLRDWLARDPDYSSQPYQHLAKTLQTIGLSEKSDEILYYGRERERNEAINKCLTNYNCLDYLWKTCLNIVVGHGYKIYYVIYWIFGFIILGVVVINASGEGRRLKMPYGIAFSFDMLLPIIRLRDRHYSTEFDLQGWARYYFYFHKIMGWLLAAFLATGVAELTK